MLEVDTKGLNSSKQRLVHSLKTQFSVSLRQIRFLTASSALSSRHRAADVFHGGEDDAPVAPLQLLHERQIVADPETSDWLLLQQETEAKTWGILDSPDFFKKKTSSLHFERILMSLAFA